jgi:hypothetical protein
VTRPISHLDVPAAELERRIAEQRLAERLGRVQWLVTHPDWPTGRATAGERAEYRHLLYDADDDATTPAFPYPTAEEA